MLTGIVLFVVLILFFVFFVVYKRDMLVKLFSLNAAAPAGEFQQELERTADAAVRRLENQIAHLELLLDEADAKIEMLDQKLQAVAHAPVIQQMPAGPEHIPPAPPPVARVLDVYLPPEAPQPLMPPVVNTPPPPAPLPPVEETSGREPMSSDRRKLILTMADQGYSVTEIAKATNTGKGEIMLLLQLNKK
jgi:hypothetical protein